MATPGVGYRHSFCTLIQFHAIQREYQDRFNSSVATILDAGLEAWHLHPAMEHNGAILFDCRYDVLSDC